ncbi:retrovirus-related pol polyprotein from transposon TNT 1-94 [Tanacetum coccineum]
MDGLCWVDGASVSLSYKSNLVSDNNPPGISLVFEYPLSTNSIFTFRQINKNSYILKLELLHFFLHSINPAWIYSVNSAEPTCSSRPTNVEVPKELPKVSMVNTSLKKLKHHLASFDVVVKERTTPTTIIEAHSAYIKHTQEEATVLRDLVEHVKANYPQDAALESAFRKPRKSKTNVPISKSKVLKSVSANKKDPSILRIPIVSVVPASSLVNAGRLNCSLASKTKSWLWHQRLSHLNFGAINHLAKHGIVRENLYLLLMDLCGPMRVASVNEKKYILFIFNDYSRFTWVKFLRSKYEAPDFIIKFLKMIQVRLKVPVRRIRTDNGTEFVNQTFREYYEKIGISHETSVARSLQQNGVVERRNRMLIEAARAMLIYAKAPLFLWAETVATAYFDELTAMDSEHSSSGLALHEMTPAIISSGLMPNPPLSTLFCTTLKN